MIPDRYTWQNFKRALDQPEKFVEEIQRIPITLHSAAQELWANQNGLGEKDAVRLIEEDWDNLIVIDACRADLFENVVDVNRFDEYRREVSIDTNTTPWSIKNFKGKGLGDTVYITGNPATSKTVPDEFHRYIETWADWEEANYLPEPVYDEAVAAAEEFPNKRLIVHFVQPHVPFIDNPELIDRSNGLNVWERIEAGEVERDAVWEAYEENLRYVIPIVFDLIEALPGRTILTSDHGNMLGETTVTGKPIYGHPGGVRCPELVEVPWCVVEGSERRAIIDDGVKSKGSVSSELVKERLAALGYHE